MVIPNNEDNICPKWIKVISRINSHTVCRPPVRFSEKNSILFDPKFY